jgi:alkylation response protein AidB-like acyl-CoA dehydrogenase
MTEIDNAWVERARAIAERIAPLGPQIERERRLPAATVKQLVDSGILKMLLPRSLGGGEVGLPTALAVLELLARADGSAGWCAMIIGTSALMSGYMNERLADEVYRAPDAITCGVFAPMGRAVRVPGGFRVSGRWPFASGCEHAAWRMGGALIVDGEEPERLPSGALHVRSILFRATETRLIDTWDTSGLRGTGSHDMEVVDLEVPEERCFSLMVGEPRYQSPAFRVPLFGALAAVVASVMLGIARASVGALVELARVKQPVGGKKTVAMRETVQQAVARAEAKLGAARAFLVEASGRAPSGNPIDERLPIRLAACHAASEAAEVVDLMYNAAGASAVYSANPLQRYFRDVHVATQHAMVGSTILTSVGRVLLGIDSDVTGL